MRILRRDASEGGCNMPSDPAREAADLLSYQEAAILLGVVPAYIYQLVNRGKLHPIRVPGQKDKRFYRREVEWYARWRLGVRGEPNPILPASADAGTVA